ncbi:hypothetical protein [Maribacter cobaltidurans]|uniref:Uncharacterized protein n=1 Tax=Maribacter cobaltidurans TaxID=1178778 RepID=A0A223V3S4_9FLAO|nr:hypothetical protein [Maribacter cobaltidurans]ASV30054.1 hypothetical protein CJ263_07355 [Maribacter cobaltidurans]GGD87574.1 hypothetical protein GCM10011412_26730 [Maribacter cobaltidurans]
MIGIFITNIQNEVQLNKIVNSIKTDSPELKVSYDLNETEKQYPCGHTVLRVEGKKINADKILTAVNSYDHNCEILEDKICI